MLSPQPHTPSPVALSAAAAKAAFAPLSAASRSFSESTQVSTATGSPAKRQPPSFDVSPIAMAAVTPDADDASAARALLAFCADAEAQANFPAVARKLHTLGRDFGEEEDDEPERMTGRGRTQRKSAKAKAAADAAMVDDSGAPLDDDARRLRMNHLRRCNEDMRILMLGWKAVELGDGGSKPSHKIYEHPVHGRVNSKKEIFKIHRGEKIDFSTDTAATVQMHVRLNRVARAPIGSSARSPHTPLVHPDDDLDEPTRREEIEEESEGEAEEEEDEAPPCEVEDASAPAADDVPAPAPPATEAGTAPLTLASMPPPTTVSLGNGSSLSYATMPPAPAMAMPPPPSVSALRVLTSNVAAGKRPLASDCCDGVGAEGGEGEPSPQTCDKRPTKRPMWASWPQPETAA